MTRSSPDPEEIRRVENVYRKYRESDRARRRWSESNRGNIEIERELRAAYRGLLAAHGMWPARSRVLDIGCGGGNLLAQFAEGGARPADLLGIDLLAENVRLARESHPGLSFVRADGRALPLADEAVGLVTIFTVLSSLLDDAVTESLAHEIDRVLQPGGGVLVYDYRVRRPTNPNVRRIGRRMISELFRGYEIRFKSVTLAPPVARRLGRFAEVLYATLRKARFLRTHNVALAMKP